MRITIEKLRTWIVVLGVLLVVAIVGSVAYARFRIHKFGADLPSKLGLEIQQSTNDFTISPSNGSHTKFLLHAAKAVQYKSGHAVLHDVTIILYAKDGSGADKISGKQFDYDPSTKIARAEGEVAIELADPSALSALDKSSTDKSARRSAKPPIAVKTSGLVFNQQTEIASTDQALTFQQGDTSGSALGATYDSSKGTLLLAHDVALHSDIDGDPITVKAEGANYDRNSRQLYFIKETTDYQDRHGSSDQAIVFFRPDGSADHMTAEGNVHLTTDDGSTLQASSGSAQLDATGQPKEMKLDGGVLYISHDATHSLHMDSTSGVVTFLPAKNDAEKKVSAHHLQLIGAVSVVDQQLSPHGSETRESRAGKMDIDLAADSTGQVQAQSVLASGGAVVNVHSIHENAPQQITLLKGNQIYATIANGHEFTSLRATGDTSLEQSTPGGADQTSSADSLLVKFVQGQGKAVPAKKSSSNPTLGENGSQIASALQQGHAILVKNQPGATPGAPIVKTTASADRIAYDGTTGTIELTGGMPRITQGDSQLTAATIDFNKGGEDATATGGVKATYANSTKAAEAMHVVADHAKLDHANDETTFTGSANADARLWQGASSITAPTIVLSKTRQLLSASGSAGGVKATFVDKSSSKSGKQPQAAVTPSVIRTASSTLTYSGGEHKVTLTGGVVVQETSGTLRAATVELYLNQSTGSVKPGTGTAASLSPNGQVERLIAENHVQFTQGDRTASGEKLVYTAEDGRYVLTGTSAAQPRVTDAQHGSVSGSSLIFNNHDDSVVVSHGLNPTTTDTRTTHDAPASHSNKPTP